VVVAFPVDRLSDQPATTSLKLAPAAVRSLPPIDGDLVRSYLRDIGRVPLLSHEQEITLGRQVQELMALEEIEQELTLRAGGHKPSPEELAAAAGLSPAVLRKRLSGGRRAKERMVAANLRLVVSVAKKYPKRNMELLDLIQEGTIGLVRGVEKFDPTRGYKFSTYAYWWIRQGMTRAIDNSARTIRLPIHISEKLSKMRRITRELSHRLGRQPNRLEMSHAMGMAREELEDLIAQSAPCASLDAHARGEEDRSTLGELIADPLSNEHFDSMDRLLQKEHLGTWLAQLNGREQNRLKLRFGLEGSEPLTLAEIGRQINVSRERVRQLEAKAIMKLRLMSNMQHAA
jgi:RNA polymerase primary sigma factor